MIAMIVDNKPEARAHLRRLLEAEGVAVVGEAASGDAAFVKAAELHPDLLLMTTEMPGLTALQLTSTLMQLDPAPLFVFVTDHPEDAVGFDCGALDCLTRPISPDRLAAMLARARSRLANARATQSTPELRVAASPPRRLPVRINYVVHLLRVEEIVCAVTRQRRVIVFTKKSEYSTHYTLTWLAQYLPREQFMRIHESSVVNLNEVDELIFLGNHAYEVRLSNDQRCPVSRMHYDELRRALGLDDCV
jgi:DNA-binding LytR/AlgR family response regulator